MTRQPTPRCDPEPQSPVPVTCATCAAVCCRLEVLCLTDTGVPLRFTRANPGGVPSMDRLADGWCAALDRDTLRCRIYDQRPLICREFAQGGPDCLAEREHWARGEHPPAIRGAGATPCQPSARCTPHTAP